MREGNAFTRVHDSVDGERNRVHFLSKGWGY